MMKGLFLILLVTACHAKPVPVQPPETAFRFTREDGVQCIMKYPDGRRKVADLKKDCGCLDQTCMVEAIHLRSFEAQPRVNQNK